MLILEIFTVVFCICWSCVMVLECIDECTNGDNRQYR